MVSARISSLRLRRPGRSDRIRRSDAIPPADATLKEGFGVLFEVAVEGLILLASNFEHQP